MVEGLCHRWREEENKYKFQFKFICCSMSYDNMCHIRQEARLAYAGTRTRCKGLQSRELA